MFGLMAFLIYTWFDQVIWYPLMLHHVPELIGFACYGVWFQQYCFYNNFSKLRSVLFIVGILSYIAVFSYFVFGTYVIASLIVSSPLLLGFGVYRVAKE